MKKSIQLNFLTCLIAGLFLTIQHNTLLGATKTDQKIKCINQTDPNIGSQLAMIARSVKQGMESFLKSIQISPSSLGAAAANIRDHSNTLSLALDSLQYRKGEIRIIALDDIRKKTEALKAAMNEFHNSISSKYPVQAADIKVKIDSLKILTNSIK